MLYLLIGFPVFIAFMTANVMLCFYLHEKWEKNGMGWLAACFGIFNLFFTFPFLCNVADYFIKHLR